MVFVRVADVNDHRPSEAKAAGYSKKESAAAEWPNKRDSSNGKQSFNVDITLYMAVWGTESTHTEHFLYKVMITDLSMVSHVRG